MATIVSSKVLSPKDLSAAEFDALVSTLYKVHCEIFDGVSRDEFAHYVVGSPADQTRIQISYGEQGDVAGYIAVHSFRRNLRGETVTISRAEAGLRRPYRGNGSPASFMLSELIRMRLSFPGPQYYLGCLVHPSSYSGFARAAATMWPFPGVEIPADLMKLMLDLGDEFHLPMVDPQRPLVRRVGWITRDSEAERAYWQQTDLPAPRYYIEQNPTYGQGHGLLTLVPLDAASLTRSAFNWGSARLKRTVQRTVGGLERTLLRSRLDALTAEELLSTAEELTGQNLDVVRQHGLLGTRFPIAARAVLFSEGEKATELYVLAEGSLFILGKDDQGEELVIDQLAPGSLVGEMEFLTGHPHAMTIRAAVDSVLLRLTRQDVEQVLTLAPRLREELWLRVCGRIFGLELRQIPALAALPRMQQEAWLAQARLHALSAGTSLVLPDGGVVVAATGRLRCEGSGGYMTLSAPCLVRLAPGSTVTALGAAHLAQLPAEPPAVAAK